jgi:formylglycine-generating enzyme required for sulfatase activity
MIRLLVTTLSFSIFILSSLWAVPPVINYAGQVRVAGQPFSGTGYLKFAFVNASGTTTYWSHDGTSVDGSEPTGELSVQVRGGLYSILLGNTALSGMGAIDLSLFQQYDDVHIRVWFNDGERGFQHLRPDRPFASVPYALSAGTAGSAGIAPGSVTLNMLGSDVQSSLSGTIDRSRLSADVLADLNKTVVITREMLPEDVQSDLNRTITLSDLAPEVLADLNDSVADGSITTNQLNEQILKYLRPEVVRSPALPQNRERVYTGQSVTLSADAEGKYLTYQWLRNGQEISGATNKEFTISDANATLHDGNYSVRISNDFGHVSSSSVQLDVNDTQLIHEVDLNASVALEMIWVEPGTFTMGQDGVATPVHEVTLTQGFYLGKYEVTQAQYEAVMTGNTDSLSATPSQWPNNPDRPVEKVSHDDIQKFLTRLNAQQAGNIPEGWAYVLPTEAQWEYACRAGTTTAYSWGDSITTDNANYSDSGYSQTRDVGLYDANPWGFFDMHGNVWEWTADAYANYATGAQTDPFNVGTSGSARVYRGGSWSNTGTDLRSAHRPSSNPSYRNRHIGFRVGFQQVPADVASPEMQILGDANITQLQGVAWVDPGVEAHDVRDGNLSGDVIVSGTVDVNTTGTYTLTYTVSDAAGNQSTLTRTVNIVEGQASTHTADLNASVALEMIWVEPGTFTMGQDGVATPVHEVTLTKGFYLGKYEVTQAQYEAVMTGNTDSLSATPSNWSNNPERPVEKVSWEDIQVFLTRLNAQQAGNIPAGWAYVLPTEAQWEYACRAGTTTAYSWGDSITTSNANYYDSGYSQTRNVGLYDANPWGFFDMHGNVVEWTADWYAVYSSGAQTDPEGPATGSGRVYRGGSWDDTGTFLRSARRNNVYPSFRNYGFGFRVGFQQVPADVASPEISILGAANITQLQGVAWVDPGVEAHDVRDGNLSGDVTVSGTVDVNTTGTYTLTYTVSDAAGNEASLTRTVNIVEGPASTHTADLNASVALEMIWVEPGTFTMGSPTSEAGRQTNETQHEVTLTQGFYLGKYEVTQAQYEAVMTGNNDGLNATPSGFGGNPNRPVVQVSWEDIQVFLTRLNEQQSGTIPAGWAYVLPTEAQWEYACRAGTTTAYSWGDSITTDNANYDGSGGETTDVGQYSLNPWGFFDMHGNVVEWTADWYAVYSSGAQTDPEGPASGSARVLRGGSWYEFGSELRSAYRVSLYPSARSGAIGFRVGFQQVPADVASPEISILGDANITQLQGVAWVDPGVEAHDVRDGNLSGDVTVSGSVDVNTTGTYTLTYTVSDAAGNQASLTRTVNIVAGQASTHSADLNASVSLEMIWVEPGTFTMGQDGVATPVHEVTLTTGFYLGKYEVTQAQYEAVMTGNTDSLSATPSNWPNNPDRPVEQVSWDDIQKFLTRLNSLQAGNIPEGWAYVLPTEAQWEYACRAGTTTAYSWGDSITTDNANYSDSGYSQTRDVGQYAANPWGFFDMHGNVWEWTADAYASYATGAQTDPFNVGTSGSTRVFRGGYWGIYGSALRSAIRIYDYPSYRDNDVGFRVGFQQL